MDTLTTIDRINVFMLAHKEECEERIRVSKQQLADITEKMRLDKIEHEKNLPPPPCSVAVYLR